MVSVACDSPERLQALTRYEILDTPPENEFDQITRMAARICDAPIAIVNFLDGERQWFKSEIGLGLKQTSLDVSFCAHVIQEPGLLVVPDTTADARFSGNALVANWPYLRFYAGVSIQSEDGFALGTVCVMDYQPRGLLDAQKETLQLLAHYAMALLELRRARKLSEQSESKGDIVAQKQAEFLATVSEELRKPLSPVLQSTKQLLRDRSLSASQRADVEKMRANLEMERKLIDELLHVAETVQGKAELQSQPTDVHACLQRAQRLVPRERATARIEKIFHAQTAMIPGDAGRLERIFWNLLTRALRTTPAAGCIALITTNPRPGLLRVRVVDTGSGIEAERLEHIFETERKSEADAAPRFDGLALSFAEMKKLVELQQGSFTVSSGGPNKGTTITIELPTFVAAENSNGHVAKNNDESLRILLVEDHESTLEALARFLRRAGHDVETAETVARARALFEQRNFDLLVSDLSLPDGNGLDLMRDLKERRAIEGVALTGYEMQFDVDACYTAGFRDCLIKPVDFDKLEKTVTCTKPAAT